MDIYKEMLAAGVLIESHQSDMYVPVTEVTRAIVARYEYRTNVTTFIHQISGAHSYDIPFAYSPFWEAKRNQAKA
jgi:hypothetical protein